MKAQEKSTFLLRLCGGRSHISFCCCKNCVHKCSTVHQCLSVFPCYRVWYEFTYL